MTTSESDGLVQAIATLSQEADSPAVEECQIWLRERGLSATPMRAGLLVIGPVSAFEEAFDTTIGRRDRRLILPVPTELKDIIWGFVVSGMPGC